MSIEEIKTFICDNDIKNNYRIRKVDNELERHLFVTVPVALLDDFMRLLGTNTLHGCEVTTVDVTADLRGCGLDMKDLICAICPQHSDIIEYWERRAMEGI